MAYTSLKFMVYASLKFNNQEVFPCMKIRYLFPVQADGHGFSDHKLHTFIFTISGFIHLSIAKQLSGRSC